ncbi:MAG TPA: general secretion pathway protein GspF [Gammaproteobacteria bacterium]|nr:general secretion pathway protein GspF [Gammaproteobacteria bacterium]
MAKRRQPLHPDAPLYHADHPRPVTRRDFLRQGFISGSGMVAGGALLSLLGNPRLAQATLSADLLAMASDAGCALEGLGAGGKIPFICFDLAGGASMVGSNVLVGGRGGYMDDPLSTAGYSKMGVPGDMVPGILDTNPPLNGPNQDTNTSNDDFTDTTLGLPFHSDSGFLRGILGKLALANATNVNGAVIPARSDNDTANNPHNPMYGIARIGADGEIVRLIGSRSSESGGNSVAPAMLINPEWRPTKVDRPSDVTGLVDTGDLTSVLSDPADVRAVMEATVRISNAKLNKVDTLLPPIDGIDKDEVARNLARCGYLKSADIANRFVGVNIDPALDPDIVGDAGIFSTAEFGSSGEFRKTASVMKMVIDGYAGAGTIQMGGYDYHTGDRAVGEIRDLRAGICIGACLEYAARRAARDISNGAIPKPLMIYVFSDGSVASNGNLDNSENGRGKGEWTGDNSSTAASFFLVYNPGGAPIPVTPQPILPSRRNDGVQIGSFRPDGSVETVNAPLAANDVNMLVQTVLLNYMALHGDQGNYSSLFGNNFGSDLDSLIAFQPIVPPAT